MKTSEFKRRVRELGYRTCENAAWLDVIAFNHHIPEVQVNTAIDVLRINSTNKDLVKLCIEYAETPISEREDEEKYRVRIPDSPERTPVYALCKLVNGCVVINQTNESNFQEHDRYKLTEAEIKRNHEYLWQFAKEVQE